MHRMTGAAGAAAGAGHIYGVFLRVLRQAQIMRAFQYLALIFVAANAEPVLPGLLVEQELLVRCIMCSVAGKADQLALNAQHDFLAAAPGFRYLHRAVGPDIDRMSIPVGIRVVRLFRFFRMADFAQYRLGMGVAHRKNKPFVGCTAMGHVAGFADNFIGLVRSETASGFDNGLRGMINRYVQRVVALGSPPRFFVWQRMQKEEFMLGSRLKVVTSDSPAVSPACGVWQVEHSSAPLSLKREIGRYRHAV